MDGQDDEQQSSRSGSRSEPVSRSRDAVPSSDDLDRASVRELGKTIHAHTQRLNDALALLDTLIRKSDFRDGVVQRTLDLHTAELERLRASIDRSLRLNREVVEHEHEAIKGAIRKLDETGEHLLHKAEPDEITGPQLKRWAWKHALPWLAARGFFVKLFATLAAAAGAAWAYLTHKH